MKSAYKLALETNSSWISKNVCQNEVKILGYHILQDDDAPFTLRTPKIYV